MFSLCRCCLYVFFLLIPMKNLYASDGVANELFANDTYETVYHPLVSSVQFSKKEIPWKQEKRGCLVQAYEPNQVEPQRVLHYNDSPQVLLREHLAIKDRDRRERVQNTLDWPYRAHGSLILYFGNTQYGGSGVLVGPRHVLTCGHNVYNPANKTWVKRISFYPALNDVTAAYDMSDVISIYTFKGWVEGANAETELALLILAKPLGHVVGYHGMACFDDALLKRETVDITGYPGLAGYPAVAVNGQMWTTSGRLKTVESEKFTYDLDTSAGQSGGAITVFKEGDPYVVGVHIGGSQTINVGVRLSLTKWKWLVDRIAETGELCTPIDVITAELNTCLEEITHNFGRVDSTETLMDDEESCLRAVMTTDRGKILQRGAKAGNPHLQAQLGKALLTSWRGAPTDNHMSMQWLRLAASQGNREARKMLREFSLTWPELPITSLPTGSEMSSLLTVRQDDTGDHCYQQATSGNAQEQVLLAKQLLENWGEAPQNHYLTVYLLRLAARQDDSEALKMLAKFGLSVEETDSVNFATLEEIEALIQVLRTHINGSELYEVAMDGNPDAQTCIGKHLLKHCKGIPQDNRLAIYLFRLAAHRYYGDCAREMLKNFGLSNPRTWIGRQHETLEEVESMMRIIDEEGGLVLYQAATENEKPLRLYKWAQGRQREDYELEKIGEPKAQKELVRRLLLDWTRLLTHRISQSQNGPTTMFEIEQIVDDFINTSNVNTEILNGWNIDQIIYTLRYIGITWCGLTWCEKNKNADGSFNEIVKKFYDYLTPRFDQLKSTVLSVDSPNGQTVPISLQRVVFLPGDNWFTFHWLKRVAMSDPEARNMLENIETTRSETLYSGLDLRTAEIDYCLTLSEMRCLVEATREEEGKQLYAAALKEDSKSQARFGKLLLSCWKENAYDNRLAVFWLQCAARKHEISAQEILKRMNIHWSEIERSVADEEDIAFHTLGIDLTKCEMMPRVLRK